MLGPWSLARVTAAKISKLVNQPTISALARMSDLFLALIASSITLLLVAFVLAGSLL
jgi:hypothetical protein